MARSDLDVNINNVTDAVKALDVKMDDLKVNIESRFDGVNGKFDDVNKKLDKIDSRLDRIDGRIDTQFYWMLGIAGGLPVLISGLLVILKIFHVF